MKNVTFSDIRDLENEYNSISAEIPPESNLRAELAKAKNLVRYRYAALALFIGIIAFIAFIG